MLARMRRFPAYVQQRQIRPRYSRALASTQPTPSERHRRLPCVKARVLVYDYRNFRVSDRFQLRLACVPIKELRHFRIQTASEVLASSSSSGSDLFIGSCTHDSGQPLTTAHHHDHVGHVGSRRLHPSPVLGDDADPRRHVLRHPRTELGRGDGQQHQGEPGHRQRPPDRHQHRHRARRSARPVLRRLARGPLGTPRSPRPEPGHLQHRRTDQRHRPELRGPPGQPADRRDRPRRRVHDRHRDDVGDGRDPLPRNHRLRS